MHIMKCCKCKRANMQELNDNVRYYKSCYLCRLTYKWHQLPTDSETPIDQYKDDIRILNEIETIKDNFDKYGIIYKPSVVVKKYSDE